MKNIYTALVASAALLMAGTVDAQSASKVTGLANGPMLTNPAAVPQHTTGNALRGGGAPVNDGCGSTTAVDLPLGGSITLSGDNTNATEDGDFVPGSGLEGFGPVVWHQFTISGSADITAAYCGTTPAFQNLAAFLARTCPATDADYVLFSSGEFTSCPDGNGTITWIGVTAGTYYFPVLMDAENSAAGPYTILLSAIAPPSNDECTSAISLTSSANCVATPFVTAGATQTMAGVECEGFTSPNANDVWFSFVCTSETQTVGVVGWNASDPVIELFTGPCNELTSLGCADGTFPQTAGETTVEQLTQSGLTVGNTYFVRVYDWGHGSPDHSFEICVTEGTGSNVGINELDRAAGITVFPNPGTGNFNLSYTGVDGLGTIAVFDLTGRVVYTAQSQFVSGTTRSLDLGGLAQGQYNVRLTVNGARTQQSVVIR